MGLTVSGKLPSGITVSNVYLSFNIELVYVFPIENGLYRINSSYKIFTDSTKADGTDIRIPICIQTSDISSGVYTLLYNELKNIYPNNVDSQ